MSCEQASDDSQNRLEGWEEIFLRPWTELTAILTRLYHDSNFIYVIFENKTYISFPRETEEARILTEALADVPSGVKVKVLSTNIPGKRIMARVVEHGVMTDD